MKLKPQNLFSSRIRLVGFTLIELMVSMAVGLVVVGAVVALSIISAQNFAAMSNYVQMNDQSRNALDRMSREIRDATALVAFSTNNPQYLELTNAVQGGSASIIYDSGSRTLTLDKTGEAPQMLLTNCDSFSFELFNRYPDISSTNISFYVSTNIVTGQLDKRFCKIIDMSWKCSKTILGSKLNTEIMQTAQVVLRNQVTE